ncbi:hypothetical protein BD626DRAFT_516179 [Schizophyllum amplum]|uniref:V-type proton ATPase subunit F n=1 Tax=Schizophyllum amplum TaxID=97359 RepID=A0A550BXB2_9AGAR|nr:hypothetical protein BD626DRAFT_516179 [Auriculariopsis ampla]
MASTSFKDRNLIAVIGDEDSITGLLLAGKKNFLIVDAKTQVAEKIRPTVDKYQQAFPALLEIPSKDHPYDPSKDSILKRVQKLFGDA